MHAARADLSQTLFGYCGYRPVGGWRWLTDRVCIRGTTGRRAGASLDVSIAAAPVGAAHADERLAAATRFRSAYGPAVALWSERATSRLGRAAASRGWPAPE
jgi:hypothetical protein